MENGESENLKGLAFVELHAAQLKASGIPEHLWNTLGEKLESEVFDAGAYFSFENIEEDGDATKDAAINSKYKVACLREDGVSAKDTAAVFLIDHSFTFRYKDVRKLLESQLELVNRLLALMDLDEYLNIEEPEEKIEAVLHHMWKTIQTYSLQSANMPVEDRQPIWYFMDEFGARIRHSDQPNCRIVPLFYMPAQTAYSVLYLLKDLQHGDELVRDFVEVSDYRKPEWRQFYLLPWVPIDNGSNLNDNFLIPNAEFFVEKREVEQLPEIVPNAPFLNCGKIKVFSEYGKVAEFLDHPAFEITNDKENADIWWLYGHFKDYKLLAKTQKFINQFPFENILTVKDLFAASVHRFYRNENFDPDTLQRKPYWFPVAFNLGTELPQFVSHFRRRAEKKLDNHWIIKPWNLARSLDMYVTDDLNCIVRLVDTGPKIACKYIERPVLFYRDDIDAKVKFDLRYIVLLVSVKPLKAFVYDRFWLRFALKKFSLDHLDDYEKHFTVFNYEDASKIKQMYWQEFVAEFIEQYPEQNWFRIQRKINNMLYESLKVACSESPPFGIAESPQSRAMFGVDLMLRWADDECKKIEPVLLEWNFQPDCARACTYYPDYMNTIFSVLFLEDSEGQPVTFLLPTD